MKLTLTPVEGGEPVASVLTSAGGSYMFENLQTGSRLLHKLPSGNVLRTTSRVHYLFSYSLYNLHDFFAISLFTSMDVQSFAMLAD